MERRSRYLVFGLAAVLVLVAVTFLLARGLTFTSATGGGPEMSLTVKVPSGVCTAGTCTLNPGDAFTLSVEIVTAPAGGYVGAQAWVQYGNDLVYNKAAAQADEIVWPDCESAVAVRGQSDDDGDTTNDRVNLGCLSGLLSFVTSTYTGNFAELSFNCSAADSQTVVELIALAESPADTLGAGFVLPPVAADQVAAKVSSLTINCGEAAAPTETPTATATVEADTPTATPTVEADTPTPTSTTEAPTATATSTTEGPTATATSTTEGPTATATSTTEAPTATSTPVPPTSTPTAAPPTSTPTAAPPTSTPTPVVTLGDVNCDRTIDSLDALWVLWVDADLADLEDLSCPEGADVDGDGDVDAVDALFILWIEADLWP